MQRVLRPLSSMTGVLTPWLLGPCLLLAQHTLQFGLGEQRQEWQLSPLPGDMQPSEIAPEPPSRPGGRWTPPLLSASWPGPLTPRGLYIHFISPTPMLHACYTLQPKCSPSSSSLVLLPPSSPSGMIGGGGLNLGLLYS